MTTRFKIRMNRRRVNKFWLATALLAGTIIGAGMFSLPYAASQAGVLSALLFLIILAGAITIVHLLFAQVVLATPGRHRLVGYATIYFGCWGRRLTLVTSLWGLYGSLLIYGILAGDFLQILAEPFFSSTGPLISKELLSLVFFGATGLAVLRGVRSIAISELIISGVLVAIVAAIVWLGRSFWEVSNVNLLSSSGGSLLLPYGVILYALAGTAAVTELKDFLGAAHDRKRAATFRRAIKYGTFIPAIVYAVFILSVVGVSGDLTSTEALSGLEVKLGSVIVWLGSLLGLAAVFSSALVLGINLRHVFELDIRLRSYLSWGLVALLPPALFMAGLRDFIGLVAFIGAAVGGLNGIIILSLYRRTESSPLRQPLLRFHVPTVIWWALVFMFLAGAIYALVEAI